MGFSTALMIATVLCGVAAAVAMVAVVRRQPAGTVVRLDRSAILVAATVGVAGVLATIVILSRRYEVEYFAIIHIVYDVVFLSLPIVGGAIVGLAWGDRRRVRAAGASAAWPTTAIVMGVALLLLVPVGVFTSFIQPYQLQTDRVTLAVAPERADGEAIRVGIFSDLQTDDLGPFEQEAIDALLATDPEIVLIAGDLFQNDRAAWEAELPELTALLAQIDVPFFVVPGDTDQFNTDLARQAVEDAGGTYLEDEITTTEVNGRPITIAGLTLQTGGTVAPAAVTSELVAMPGNDDLRIVLTHRPDAVLSLPAADPHHRVDLVVAGHTHGGQIALPVIGPLVTLSQVPRSVGAGGLGDVDGYPIYVSSGVGMERNMAPQMRFLVPPKVVVLTLESP